MADFPINKKGDPVLSHVWWKKQHSFAADTDMFTTLFDDLWEIHRTPAWIKKKVKAARAATKPRIRPVPARRPARPRPQPATGGAAPKRVTKAQAHQAAVDYAKRVGMPNPRTSQGVVVGFWDHEPQGRGEHDEDELDLPSSLSAVKRRYPRATTYRYNKDLFILNRYLPGDFVRKITQDEAEAVWLWLSRGAWGPGAKGTHRCLLCGAGVGTSDGARDGFFYPESLTHYAREHKVVPPGLYEYMQVRLIGNSVPPQVVSAIIRANR